MRVVKGVPGSTSVGLVEILPVPAGDGPVKLAVRDAGPTEPASAQVEPVGEGGPPAKR